jgi:SAM-dependent methyltransferase/uncharacterized protein YbaR (Trm112 family)
MPVAPPLLEKLVCPVDKSPLRLEPRKLISEAGRTYPLVDDAIPVMIIPNLLHTFDVVDRSRQEADKAIETDGRIDPSIWGWSSPAGKEPHPFVSKMVSATCGYMYEHMVGNLVDYPIPTLRLPPGKGKRFLDLGCNWGRWCIAANRLGYEVYGLDPVLEAIHAARTVAGQMGVDNHYVCGDAVRLPFADNTMDVIFSYSVLQHFARQDVVSTLAEIKRVLRPGGRCLIQMANTYGIRCLYHQARRGFRDSQERFSVRYWTPGQLKQAFTQQIGETTLTVDGFFNLNPQPSETKLLPWRFRAVVGVSETLRKASRYVPPLTWAADSLYISAVKS